MDEYLFSSSGRYLKQMRTMFYLVTPNETSFETVDEVPSYIDKSNTVFMSFLIAESLISLLLADGYFRVNDGITSCSAGLLTRLPCVVIKSIHLTTYKWVHDNFRLTELPWDSPWTWFLTLLLVDLAYYWFHRLAHEVNILWAAHQVHHSSEDYNLSTALRQSVFQTYTSWMMYLPLALAIPTSVFAVHDELNILFQFWIHTKYIRTLGPLEYILNTPNHHRIHHGSNPYCIDKNYAGVLIIWDRLFGTFQAEEEKITYGLITQINTFEPLEIQLKTFKSIWQRIRNGENVCNVLFRGPGWQPEDQRQEKIENIPAIETSIKKYDPQLPPWYNVYIFIHFLTLIGLFEYLLSSKELMSQWSVLASLLFIGFSLTCFGRLFDKRWYAPLLEMIRCVIVFFLTTTVLRRYIPKSQQYIGIGVQFFYLASIIPWVIYIIKYLGQSKSKRKKNGIRTE